MTKSAHFGSNSSFGLSKAILVYSDGQQLFATMHQPRDSPDGGPPYLDAGEALTIDFLKQLAKGTWTKRAARNSSVQCSRSHSRHPRLVDETATPGHVL